MDLSAVFLAILILAYVLLNVMGSSVIKASEIHDTGKKIRLFVLLWGLPLLGVFIVTRQINKDIKDNQAKMEEQIAPAIREVADRLKLLETDISRSRSKSTVIHSKSKSTKIH